MSLTGEHINNITCKASKILGFIRGNLKKGFKPEVHITCPSRILFPCRRSAQKFTTSLTLNRFSVKQPYSSKMIIKTEHREQFPT